MRTRFKYIYIICFALFVTLLSGSFVWGESSNVLHSLHNTDPVNKQQQEVTLKEKGSMHGIESRKVERNKGVTRADFILMVTQSLNIQRVESEIAAFDDVPRDTMYYGAVQASLLLHLIDKKADRLFQPHQEITRQEAIEILMRVFKQSTTSYRGGMSDRDINDSNKKNEPDIQTMQKLGFVSKDEDQSRLNEPLTYQAAEQLLQHTLAQPDWVAALAKVPPQRIELGWQYNLTTKQFISEVAASPVNTLSPSWYMLDQTEFVSDQTDQQLITWAKKNGKQVWPLIGNRANAELTHQVLTDKKRKQTVISKLVYYVKKHKLHGLNLDFENMFPQDQEAFTSFVNHLALELHKVKAVLSVDVPPDSGTDWSNPFDYVALGKTADYIILMGYEEHWPGGSVAGSVSSLPWLSQALDKLLISVPAHKTIVALPLYTRDWVIQDKRLSARDMTLTEQREVVRHRKPLWNAAVGQYVIDFMENGKKHKIWLEDSRSLAEKYTMVAHQRVAGFAYWYLGAGTADIWKMIENQWRYTTLLQ